MPRKQIINGNAPLASLFATFAGAETPVSDPKKSQLRNAQDGKSGKSGKNAKSNSLFRRLRDSKKAVGTSTNSTRVSNSVIQSNELLLSSQALLRAKSHGTPRVNGEQVVGDFSGEVSKLPKLSKRDPLYECWEQHIGSGMNKSVIQQLRRWRDAFIARGYPDEIYLLIELAGATAARGHYAYLRACVEHVLLNKKPALSIKQREIEQALKAAHRSTPASMEEKIAWEAVQNEKQMAKLRAIIEANKAKEQQSS